MDRFARFLFSMRSMAVGLIIFFVAIGWATILEAKYDTQTAKIVVYNALWFEVLLAFLCVNLIANIFAYRMYQREKIAMFAFHVAFIIIILGAAVTRFFGFEGMMLIREGAEINYIYTSDPYLWVRATEGGAEQEPRAMKLYMSEATDNYFSMEIPGLPNRNEPVQIEYEDFRKNLIDSLVINDSITGTALNIVTDGMKPNYVSEGGFLMLGDIALSFDKRDAMPGIQIHKEGRKILVKTELPMRYLAMSELQKAAQMGGVNDSLFKEIPLDTLVPFQTATLYQVGDQQFVFKEVVEHAKTMAISSERKGAGRDCLTVKITDGNNSKLVDLYGGYSQIPDNEVFSFNGVSYQMQYGSMMVQLPFAIKCRDFQLDKYPGSTSPSSFASEVTVIDEEMGVRKDKRIFMNHVLDYRGYRFFQSGYDPDEMGTRLSVNYDWWGTNISYLGYLLMGIGMILSLLSPTGRFRELNKKIKKSREMRQKLMGVITALILSGSMAFGQSDGHTGHDHVVQQPVFRVMSVEHSDKVASLLVQNFQGRIIPMHTQCDQLLRKLYRANTYEGYNAVQTIMSMHMYHNYWMTQDVIYVSSKSNLRDKLGMTGSHISYLDLTDTIKGQFRLQEDYAKAHQTPESKRGEYEKRILQLGERYEVISMIFTWEYMKLIPIERDPNHTWYSPFKAELETGNPEGRKLLLDYLNALNEASKSGSYKRADELLDSFKKMQREMAKAIVPSESLVSMEIRYNKMNIFKNTYRSYLAIGFILLVIFFIGILVKPTEKSEKRIKRITRPFTWIAIAIFLYHGYGVYMRWMISGHAPWSNAYEAVVFIGWIAVLTGLLFSKKNRAILAVALILASLMIFVTELNLLDPEVTQLQPVLKSYWLMIHVAIITGSYAPLGISCILGLLNLLLYTFRNKKNGDRITANINVLSYVAEMSMMIGVFMLTIGTFLGGVWANESWGRYWGWDPKETWALVAVLVYATILHFRFIPGLKGKFLFNAASLWGYASIMFTFFGVNFYLVGLHSYAQGDGLGEFPTSVIITIIAFAIFTGVAAFMNKRYKRFVKESALDE